MKFTSKTTLLVAIRCPGHHTAPPLRTRRTARLFTDWSLVLVIMLSEFGSVQKTLRPGVAVQLVPVAGRRNLAPVPLLMPTGCVTWPSRPALLFLTACSQVAQRTRLCTCGGNRSTVGNRPCFGNLRRLCGESVGL